MPFAEEFLHEFDYEMKATRTLLERVPLPAIYGPTADTA